MNNDVFITSGFLPVPATKGGAVETLVQNLIDENEIAKKNKFTIFSIYDKKAYEKSKMYSQTNFLFYKPNFIIKFLDLILFFILTTILRKEKKTSYKFIVQRLFYLNYVSKKLKKYDFHSIIVENNATLFLALKWRKNYLKYKDRYYFHLHNDIDKLYGCKEIIENSKKILTVSNYISSIVISKLNYDPNRVVVFKNCIDMEKFKVKYSQQQIDEIKMKHGLTISDKVIIFVGRTIKEKGILEVLKAFKLANKNNWTLMIIGSSGFDINIKSDFERELFEETQNNKKIIFTGFIPYKTLPIYYALADLAVLPSIWNEPAGLTMLEAVASGVPLITTNSGGIPEYVSNYGATILDVDDNLVSNIANNMEKILSENTTLNNKLVEDCRNNFNLKKYLENFNDCITERR